MRFDGLSRADAEAELLACCASRRWAAAVAGGRPYGSAERLLAAAGRAVRDLDWPDVEEALHAHPRIGERTASALSRQEQAGVGDGDRAAFAVANAEYEERFGHVFLIRAGGRSAAEMLAELRERLGNDPAKEREVVRGELAEITELRLRKLVT
ncbi:2-oxo-4-hydroxy-4-carboxy-5-ureidoimidazoline decarboxylase [Actinoallomurus oryzae]|uniref:2-oxo-4-hydroxy-4-carboxy-5-ureidoimidazoline decarboxylase n=1 Tax=Actinoallomurus oryzae TaxID=502180 RepID=A0ABP8R285_9ACTN